MGRALSALALPGLLFGAVWAVGPACRSSEPDLGVQACGRCHVVPPAELLPRERWPDQIYRAAGLVEQYGLGTPLTAAEVEAALSWYQARAPETLEKPALNETPSPVPFVRRSLGESWEPGDPAGPPIIGHVSLTDLDGDGHPDVVVSDTKANALRWVRRDAAGVWQESVLGDVAAPTRTEPVDFDGDGDLDILVAALGTLAPTDDEAGEVVLLEQTGEGWVTRVLATGLPKVCDVRPGDLDGDGDLDIMVAAFGMFHAGGAGWLENRQGHFVFHWVLQRNGTSHVPLADLDGNGLLDAIVLISQEHEVVLALLNQGGGRFEQRPLYTGPHPMYGLSNLAMVDLDRDGDSDVLLTNGDALDADPHPKPWHGVQWLENQGDLRFDHHWIGPLYDASAVAAGDLDGDGDLDVVATSMANLAEDPVRQSVVWYENDGAQGFSRHPLDDTPTALVSLAVGDLDGDGRVDVLAGAMNVMPPFVRIGRMAAWTHQ